MEHRPAHALDPSRALDVFATAVAAALRAGRATHALSQRELAKRAGLSQSAVARLETGRYDARLSWVVAALEAVDLRLDLPVTEAQQRWRRDGEFVRDEAGRRLPAHLQPYRLRFPHSWWPGQTQILMWPHTPKWSYRRRPVIGRRTPRPRPPRSEPC
jgi:transcriptional regulator with XRE-family HTH domain